MFPHPLVSAITVLRLWYLQETVDKAQPKLISYNYLKLGFTAFWIAENDLLAVPVFGTAQLFSEFRSTQPTIFELVDMQKDSSQ